MTEILFILDRSGSMTSCASDAVGGFNSFLKDQKKKPKGKRLTLLQFDHEIEYTYDRSKLKDCKKLVLNETYSTRGTTALLDAIGIGLNHLKKADKAIVAIYTDGYENASREWSPEAVKKAIKKANKKGWEVIFLAADIDTKFATQTLGMSASKVATVRKSDIGKTMGLVSNYTRSYASSGKQSSTNLQEDHDKAVSKGS